MNDGSAPGETIELVIQAPAGARLATELPSDDLRLPARPTPPRPAHEMFGGMVVALPPSSRFEMPNFYARQAPRSPYKLGSDGATLKISMGNLRHDSKKRVPPFFVAFTSYEGAASFALGLKIHAHNLPEAARREVNVRITKTDRYSPLQLERSGGDDTEGHQDGDEEADDE